MLGKVLLGRIQKCSVVLLCWGFSLFSFYFSNVLYSLTLPEETPRPDRLRFHDRCGSLVKLSSGNRSAERRRPLDEFNNGVVMTQRPLKDSELFEIRIDRLVDKWSGSIEVRSYYHNFSEIKEFIILHF